MSHHRTTNPSEWPVRYPPPVSSPTVERAVQFASDRERLMDIYYPGAADKPLGVIIVASGYPSFGLKKHFGRSAREFASVRSWCELIAAQGLAAVAYDAVDPAADLPAIVEHLTHHGADLGIDPSRIGIFACSGNAPIALGFGLKVQCAVLMYGFTVDVEGTSAVADAARKFGFALPSVGLATTDASIPTLIVRAGRDAFVGVNESIDAYVVQALRRNLPMTLINHPTAPHAFDLVDDSEDSHSIIRQILAFVGDRLCNRRLDR